VDRAARGQAALISVRRRPARRWGETHDLVGACRFLASAAAEYVSSIVIPVDGRYTASNGPDRG
jgi:NAD(P)-dependent dehydrogenase (short-subunit alcohol dehydrogenase family)